MVDLFMPFIRPELREDVRLQILGIIHEPIYDEPEIGGIQQPRNEHSFAGYNTSGAALPLLPWSTRNSSKTWNTLARANLAERSPAAAPNGAMRKLISMSFRLVLGDDRGVAGPPFAVTGISNLPDGLCRAGPRPSQSPAKEGWRDGNAVRKESASPKPPSVAVVDRVGRGSRRLGARALCRPKPHTPMNTITTIAINAMIRGISSPFAVGLLAARLVYIRIRGRADRRVRRNRTALSLRHFRFDFLDRLISVLLLPSFRSPFPLPDLVSAASDAFFPIHSCAPRA
nr:hypothetical protein [Mesorhizobium sp.]